MNSLVHCPHCGETDCLEVTNGAEFSGHDEEDYPHSPFAVVCNANKGGCGAMGGFAPTKETAAIKWNQRSAEVVVDRKRLREMFGGKCAYCGKPLSKIFHADHVAPIYREWTDTSRPQHSGKDVEENIFPACPRCNIRKSVLTVEAFRYEISMQVERLRRDSSAFNLAEDFGIIAETGKPVVFWFEKYCESAGV